MGSIPNNGLCPFLTKRKKAGWVSVKVRLTGSADDVKFIAEGLRHVLDIRRESENYLNREDEGVRCWLEARVRQADDERE